MALGWVPATGPSVALEVFHCVNNTALNSLLHKDFPTFKMVCWIPLVVPWLRVCLPVKGTQVLIPRQGRHHMLQSSSAHALHLLKPACPRPGLCNEKPLQREVLEKSLLRATRGSLHSHKDPAWQKKLILRITKNKMVSLVRWLDTHTYTNTHTDIHTSVFPQVPCFILGIEDGGTKSEELSASQCPGAAPALWLAVTGLCLSRSPGVCEWLARVNNFWLCALGQTIIS